MLKKLKAKQWSKITSASARDWSNCEELIMTAREAYGEVEFHGGGHKTTAQVCSAFFHNVPKIEKVSHVNPLSCQFFRLF